MPKIIDPNKPVKVARGWKHKYGFLATEPLDDWHLELFCWRERFNSGLEPVEHLRRCIALLLPDEIWNPWRERRFRSLTDERYADRIGKSVIRNLPWVGPGSAGKTWDSGILAFFFWLADPLNTAVALTTTSKPKMRQRVWPAVQECYERTKDAIRDANICEPNMLNSTLQLQANYGDAKHAIFGQAVEQGELATAVEKLKGLHAPRIMLVIDEAPGTPEAIFRTIPNMQKGAREVVVIFTGNGPLTHYDCFSRVCKPVNGWKSITADAEEWRTAAIPEFQLPQGWCIHFDGKTSPNVVAGQTIYPFLYTWEDWQRSIRDPLRQGTAEFYSQDRGFWPPEGFLRTVLTEELIEQGNARGTIEFAGGTTTPIGSVDPGFGGDKCVLRLGRMGRKADNKLAVQIDETHYIPILVDLVDESGKKIPAEYQIWNFIRPHAERLKIKPHCFGVESTGTGRGVAAVMTQEWGEILAVESGGKPTDMPASEEDARPSHQVYDRKITELWFSVQAFVKGKHIGGLTEADCEQFCARLYDFISKKYILEKKEDLKPRLGRSPDDADSCAVLIHVARTLGMATRGPRGDRMMSMWDSEIQLQQRVYAEDALYQPEEAA